MNTTPSAGTLGVVAPAAHRRALQQLATAAGCEVVLCGGVEELAGWRAIGLLDPRAAATPMGWLIDVSAAEDAELLDELVAEIAVPLLLCDEPIPIEMVARMLWQIRMKTKLEELAASLGDDPPAQYIAPQAVWVLAASTGGPSAVSEFLAALAPGLPIALVYAQHIESTFDRVLARALARHDHYGVDLCRAGQRLTPGRVLVVPAEQQVRFLPFHRVVRSQCGWEGRYQPAIDPVVAQVARLYQARCGVIVFSGMCDDGALGCRILRGQGGEVWAQSPASCISSDMPVAALATGTVSFEGTPVELAQALNVRYSNPSSRRAVTLSRIA